jgi:hypothetical protein
VWGTKPLAAEHERGFLNSGRSQIDSWFHEHALRVQTEGRMRTYVWDDQAPYVSAFYSLVPHVLPADDGFYIPGDPLGGPLSGFLIAKLGINQNAVGQESELPGHPEVTLENEILLLVDAMVTARRAALIGGGRYAFIDTSNEPPHILTALGRVGFKSVTEAGHPVHVVRLGRPGEAPG